jgi:hypothetical protein
VDDLICYKIEYDLENAANTQYTFGVPKQTLTERYKKDKVKAVDASESAAASGGGGGGKAAAEEGGKEIHRIYSEWVDWDPDDPDGRVSIGAMYREYRADKEKLKNEVGIDLNAIDGNININALRTEFDQLGSEVVKQGAHINVLQTNTEAELNLQASRVDTIDGREIGHYADIILKANNLESSIALKADKITIDAKLFSINETIDGIETNVASFNSKITKINSDITAVRKLIADEIEAMKGNIDWLSGKTIILQNGLYADLVRATSELSVGGKPVATQEWVEGRGYQTNSGVSWGNVSTGFVWLNIGNNSKYLAMGNHTHAEYLKSLPSHRHSFSGSYTLGWGHTHAASGAGGVNNYSAKIITISGNTGYSS